MYLRSLEENKDGWNWRAKQTAPGELISILLGPSCRDASRVALDPLPESEDGGITLELLSTSRGYFVQMLLGEGEDGQEAYGEEHTSHLSTSKRTLNPYGF